MKLYTSIGPNPRVVRMFLIEKQLAIPLESVDIHAGVNRQSEYLKINPKGQTPALLTDDGAVVTEITAICEYIDEIHPGRKLMGIDALERAVTRKWVRCIDLNIVEPMANGFRFAEALMLFEQRIHCIPQAADDLKAIAQEQLSWLDTMMQGKEFIANDKFSLADIILYCFLDFAQNVGQKINPDNKNIQQWFEKVSSRTSAKESVHQME